MIASIYAAIVIIITSFIYRDNRPIPANEAFTLVFICLMFIGWDISRIADKLDRIEQYARRASDKTFWS